MTNPATDNKKNPTSKEIKSRLIFAPIMIIGGLLLLMFASYPKLQKAAETKSWAQTQGKINKAWIVAHKNGIDRRHKENLYSYASDEGNKFRVDIEYSYKVDTSIYTCRKRHLMQSKDEGFGKYNRAEIKKNYFMNKKDITVYYNPQDPKEALLRAGLNPLNWLLVISPILLLIAGFPLLYSAIKWSILKPNK